MSKINLNSTIDHTLLKPATVEQLEQLCNEAKKFSFASVCVNPCHVKLCAKMLCDSQVRVCTVVGFPLGENTTATKVFETKEAIKNGATEIDMVVNQSAAKQNDFEYIEKDIAGVVKAANGVLVKVILETCNLSEHQIEQICKCSVNAGAIFVKTSTGFGSGGATVDHVKLMHDTVSQFGLFVKASGGVRTTADAQKMIEAGASRIGTSNGIAIVEASDNANAKDY